MLEIVAAQREMTVQDLMRHTSGLTYGVFGKSMVKDLYTKNDVDGRDHSNAEFVKKLATVPLMFQPGTTWEYSRSTDVLGHVIERVSGMELDRFLEERILKPLGMVRHHIFRRTRQARANCRGVCQRTRIPQRKNLVPVRERPKHLSRRRHGVHRSGLSSASRKCCANPGGSDGAILSPKTGKYDSPPLPGAFKGPPPSRRRPAPSSAPSLGAHEGRGRPPPPGRVGETTTGGALALFLSRHTETYPPWIWMVPTPTTPPPTPPPTPLRGRKAGIQERVAPGRSAA